MRSAPPCRSGSAGQWSDQVIPELGHYALMLALGLSLIQGNDADRRYAHQRCRPDEHGARRWRLRNSFSSRLRSVRLGECYVASDFSVLNVYENSNSAMPLIYRLTSIWGNHEGSMMLWVSILAFFGALVAVFGTNLPLTLESECAGRSGLDCRRVLFVHPDHV